MSGIVPELTAVEVQQRLISGAVHLLDCREHDEVLIARISGAAHIPMNDIPQRLGDIPRDRPVVVYCHHGRRSDRVAAWLLQQGFADVANMTGGIDAWSRLVDPSVPRY